MEVRIRLVADATAHIDGVSVESFDGLLAHYAADIEASVIVRGLRHGSDLEYEAPMASANHALLEGLETVFLLARADRTRISSNLVREVYFHGGNIDLFVPKPVAAYLRSIAKT